MSIITSTGLDCFLECSVCVKYRPPVSGYKNLSILKRCGKNEVYVHAMESGLLLAGESEAVKAQ